MSEPKKRLKLSSQREIRKALNRIANMVLNKEIDPKSANTLGYLCNITLSTFEKTEQEGTENMKSNRQFTIQQLLRAAEITGDSERREQYLDEADKLLRQELTAKEIAAAKKSGLLAEE